MSDCCFSIWRASSWSTIARLCVGDKLLCAMARGCSRRSATSNGRGAAPRAWANKEALVSVSAATNSRSSSRISRSAAREGGPPCDRGGPRAVRDRGSRDQRRGNIGIACFRIMPISSAGLIRAADLAMYQARTLARTCSMSIRRRSKSVMRTVSTSSEAAARLANEAFELHYQPVISMAADVVEGVEVLLRWQDGEDHLLLPPDFMTCSRYRHDPRGRRLGHPHACRQLRGCMTPDTRPAAVGECLAAPVSTIPTWCSPSRGHRRKRHRPGLRRAGPQRKHPEPVGRSHHDDDAGTADARRADRPRPLRHWPVLPGFAAEAALSALKVDLFFVHDLVESVSSRAIARRSSASAIRSACRPWRSGGERQSAADPAGDGVRLLPGLPGDAADVGPFLPGLDRAARQPRPAQAAISSPDGRPSPAALRNAGVSTPGLESAASILPAAYRICHDYRQRTRPFAAALEYHALPRPGKISVVPTKGLTNQRDLAWPTRPASPPPAKPSSPIRARLRA